jgi:hypothetical protein
MNPTGKGLLTTSALIAPVGRRSDRCGGSVTILSFFWIPARAQSM